MKALLLALALVMSLRAGDPARDNRWQQDLSYLAAQLPARHPDFYQIVNRVQFQQAVSDLNAAIPNLSDAGVMLGLAKLTAMLNDGHTSLPLTQANAQFHLLPLTLQWFNDGLYVTGAGPAYTRALGARIVQMGDRATDDAYALLLPAISHENDIWVRAESPYSLVNADILLALGITSTLSPVHFVLQDQSGAQFTLDIPPLDPGQYAAQSTLPDPNTGFTPFARQSTSLNYWFTYVPSSRLLYFAYNACQQDPTIGPFGGVNTQFWAAFDANPVDTLVLDLRNNGGGNSSIFDPFVASWNQRAARLAGVRSYIILGRFTFSSAILNAISLDHSPLKKVGEPTGGSPNSYGEVLSFSLPNSRLAVYYSTRYFSFPQYPPGSMLPDINVPLASADYFARHDPFLAAALANAQSIPAVPPPSSLSIANAATLRTDLPVAPGSLASAFADFPNPADVSLLVNGTPAPILAVVPGQVNFQVPADTTVGLASFQLEIDGAVAASATRPVAATAPGLFIADPLDTARPAAGVSTTVAPGDVLHLYATGLTSDTPRIYFGTEEAAVLASQPLPSVPGLWEVDVAVPSTPVVNAQVPIFISLGNAAGNGVTVTVKR